MIICLVIITFNKPLKTAWNFKTLSRLFWQQEKASLPHAMLSLLFPDPLPFSVHPQEVSLRARLYRSTNSRGWCVWNGYKSKHSCTTPECWPRGSHASYKSQHGNFCKSVAEYPWMLSNPIQDKGQICKLCCTLGNSSTKLLYFMLHKATKQELINYNPDLNYLHSFDNF